MPNKQLKVLNLYAGIGGNRKMWPANISVTAVEHDEDIANIYSHYFPSDKIIIADAHEYLLKHYNKFDFIWASPPCQTHSRLAKKPRYIDCKLWQEIIFLQHFAKVGWIVENVIPYYKVLIHPTQKISRHFIWANFNINPYVLKDHIGINDITTGSVLYGYHLAGFKTQVRKDQILRNCVNPLIGLHILNQFNLWK